MNTDTTDDPPPLTGGQWLMGVSVYLLVLALVPVLLFFFGWVLLAHGCESMERTAFDGPAWRATGKGQPPVRTAMVDDVIGSGMLERKTRQEVLALLGPDDSATGTGWGAGYFGSWDLVYWIGDERGFIRIDSEWLVIDLDAEGRVARYRLVTD